MKFAKYLFLGLFLTSTSHAYLSVSESAELTPNGKYQIGIEPQILTNNGGGTNFDLFLDMPINDSTSARILMGAGAVDFNAFASLKWIPFPDVDRQPAMGLRVGGGLARDEEENLLQLQFAPMASKKFDSEIGLLVPYVAVPFTFLNTKKENIVASNLAIGSEYHPVDVQNLFFGAEIGANLSKSFSYISVFMTFSFDANRGAW